MSDGFLKKVYDLASEEDVRAYYDDWAKSYDAEITDNGYATPRRCAQALASCTPDKDGALLDMGCGTGLSGLAFRAEGFTTIDGADVSQGMMEKAAKTGAYRALLMPRDIPQGGYDMVAAVGVIGQGAGPPELFDTCLTYLRSGGLFVLSLNDHALSVPEYPAVLTNARQTGAVTTRFEEHGEHLPGINVKSTVYVLEKN